VGGIAVRSAQVCLACTALDDEHQLVHSFAVALRHAGECNGFTRLPVASLKSPPHITIDTRTLHTMLKKVKYRDVPKSDNDFRGQKDTWRPTIFDF
jgi:hypothetical protein